MHLNRRSEADFQVLEVTGEIDVYTAPRLREAIVELIGEGNNKIIIDVDRVDFLDSTGLGVLVGGLKKVRENGGSLEVICSQSRIRKIFEITGLDQVFGLHDDISGATSRD